METIDHKRSMQSQLIVEVKHSGQAQHLAGGRAVEIIPTTGRAQTPAGKRSGGDSQHN